MIGEAGAPEAVARLVSSEARRRSADFDERWKAYSRGDWLKEPFKPRPIDWTNFSLSQSGSGNPPTNPGAIHRLPGTHRLALEMALHESSEQEALEGDLAPLEKAWREAEEIAAIADNLLTG